MGATKSISLCSINFNYPKLGNSRIFTRESSVLLSLNPHFDIKSKKLTRCLDLSYVLFLLSAELSISRAVFPPCKRLLLQLKHSQIF